MVLYVYVLCLCVLTSLGILHMILGDEPLISEVVLSQVPKSNERTEIVGEVLYLKIMRVTQRMAQISLRKPGLE
jgi:hypothetical protein